MRGIFLRITVLVLIGATLGSCARKSEPRARQVVLYCSVDQTLAEPIIAAFESQSGIKVLTRFDTEAAKTVGLVQRLRSEQGAPVADVFWSSEIFYTIRLAREGLFTPYQDTQSETWPESLKDPNYLWYGFALRARVIGYHTDRVTNPPRSLEDMLDRKWQGRIVMATPEFGTTGGDVTSWFVHYGSDRARAILKGLKANDIRLVEGNSTAVRMVATGQADVCFTDTDDVYAAQRNGWPLAMVPLDQAGQGNLAIPNTAAMIKHGPHAEEARELMAFLLSDELERSLAESDSHNSPIHASLVETFKAYRLTTPLKIRYEPIADQLTEAIQTAREMLL
ncbi:MAG: extracellular solute-binding protein [Phycisphaerae bacterium]|nr:extracellular solute-binding protein [Phycisphaerae bacterium]